MNEPVTVNNSNQQSKQNKVQETLLVEYAVKKRSDAQSVFLKFAAPPPSPTPTPLEKEYLDHKTYSAMHSSVPELSAS